MPANLTPQYQAAEERYRAAQTAEEKIEALRRNALHDPQTQKDGEAPGGHQTRLAKAQQEHEQRKKSGGRRHDPAISRARGPARSR